MISAPAVTNARSPWSNGCAAPAIGRPVEP